MQLDSSWQTAIVVFFCLERNKLEVSLPTVHKGSHTFHTSRTTRLHNTRACTAKRIAVCCRSEMVLDCTVNCVRSLNTGRENCARHLRSSHQRSQWTMQKKYDVVLWSSSFSLSLSSSRARSFSQFG